jgi:bifunctional enzyme CysN/CysC
VALDERRIFRTRTDQAHLSSYDVQQLREFVELGLRQPPAEPRESLRVENIRRVAEVARLMADAGLIVLVAFISPFRSERRMARELIGAGEFIEVYVNTPLDIAEARDPKGLYRKARRGELKTFTGIDSPYEAPEAPDLELDTSQLVASVAAEHVLACLSARGLLEG